MKLLVLVGLMPKRRSTEAGTSEYWAPESTRNLSRGLVGFAMLARVLLLEALVPHLSSVSDAQ
jgi:hypothetical protein